MGVLHEPKRSRIDPVSRLVIGLSLLAATCGSCAHRSLVPMVPRPDTRRVRVVHVDSAAVRGTMQILEAALPSEAAVCYGGRLYDSTVTRANGQVVPVLVLMLNTVAVAEADSADAFNVYRPHCTTPLIALGHSHPYNQRYGLPCDHSDDDAALLLNTPRALVSLAWCGDGQLQFFWQDGRRGITRWRPGP